MKMNSCRRQVLKTPMIRKSWLEKEQAMQSETFLEVGSLTFQLTMTTQNMLKFCWTYEKELRENWRPNSRD